MMERMKRVLALLLCACLLLPAAFAAAEGAEGTPELLKEFILHHGDRNSKKIAITVDDCYKSATEWIERNVELCKEYDVAMTFFPLVYTGCLEEKYRDLWQSVIDSGCEIGTHTNKHVKLGNRDAWGIISGLGKAQEALDKTLGYHYEIRWLRPPYGNVGDGNRLKKQQVVSAIKKYGFNNIVHWDVSETKNLEKALGDVQNGSILLYHARHKDYTCLETLIPQLLESGFEPVTVSELFGFDPPKTSKKKFVYDKEVYIKKWKQQ